MSHVLLQQVQIDHQIGSMSGQANSFLSLLRIRDPYTGLHSDQVQKLASQVGSVFGLDRVETEKIEIGAYLHDIGKMAIPDEILRKPGSLDADEWEIMKSHSALGAAALREMPNFREIAPIVLHHHERYDGSGYPSQLAGEQIPLGSRIISVLDALDALTTDRPYRKAQSIEVAGVELLLGKGAQFDPDVVDAVLEVIGYRAPVIQ